MNDNFLKLKEKISENLAFMPLESDYISGEIQMKKGLEIPLSKFSLKNISEENVDIDIISVIRHMHIVSFLFRELVFVNDYDDILLKISKSNDDLLKLKIKNIDNFQNTEEKIAFLYSYAVFYPEFDVFNELGIQLLHYAKESDDEDYFYSLAYDSFLKSIQINRNSCAFYFKSYLEREFGRYEMALESAKTSKTLNSENEEIQDIEEIIENLEYLSRLQKALVLISEKDRENAKKLFFELEKFNEKTEDYYYLARDIYLNHDDLELAKILKEAIEKYPKEYELYNSYAVCLYNLAQVKEAISCLETAVRLNPKDKTALYNLSEMYKKTGRIEIANEIKEHLKLV